MKKDRFGYILKYKAQWVAYGYKQEEGLDVIKTFGTVVKPMSHKCFFVVGVKCGYQIRQMDVVLVFLYDFLDEVIYMEQPHLFATEFKKICKLIKALYRLKQSLHVWYKTFVEFFKKLGFTWLELDHEIFVSVDKHLLIAVYVDDLFILSLDVSHLENV